MNILAVDIGNTTIAFGVFKAKRLILNFKLPTHAKSLSFYKKNISGVLKKAKISVIDKIVICSVVPEKTKVISNIVAGILKKKTLVA
ncbi:MAG: type III pantothenate kinase, partial [Candidatus Omnitrophica bacterium]|nr:type III pantothenate kinase [Candidatus Omnitrophota bacterium]